MTAQAERERLTNVLAILAGVAVLVARWMP